MNVIILKSFIFNGHGGNGAGLVVLDDDMDEDKMQKISSEVGLSETVFLKKIDKENYDVRFFTPVCEVELCGHATIAAFYYVGEKLVDNKTGELKLYQNTRVGKLKILINYNDKKVENVLMQQTKPQFYGCVLSGEKFKIAKSLGADVSDIMLPYYKLEPEIVSTGLKDILIPVKDRVTLNSLHPDFDLIKEISEKNDTVGYHVYTIDKNKVYARNFAPLVGINEECATGTSNGALGALLFRENIKKGHFEVLQGEMMNELSQIFVYADEYEIMVGGTARICC